MVTPIPHTTLLLFLLSSLPAAAGNWRIVVDNEMVRAETDISTLTRNGDIVKTWEKETYRKPEQAKPGDFYFKSAKSLVQHHCANRTSAYLFKAYYSEDGKEIKAITSSGDLDKVDHLPPDSLEERQLLFACNFKSSPARQANPPVPAATAAAVNDKNKMAAVAAKSSDKPTSPASSVKPPIKSEKTKAEENKLPATPKSAGGK